MLTLDTPPASEDSHRFVEQHHYDKPYRIDLLPEFKSKSSEGNPALPATPDYAQAKARNEDDAQNR